MTDLSRLEELARKATPGTWIAQKDPHSISDEDWVIGRLDGKPDEIAVCSERDAHLIAACDPQTIMALLDRLKKAEAERDAFKARENRVFELGWRVAASWADRTDLHCDTESPAYIQDRDKELAALAIVEVE